MVEYLDFLIREVLTPVVTGVLSALLASWYNSNK